MWRAATARLFRLRCEPVFLCAAVDTGIKSSYDGNIKTKGCSYMDKKILAVCICPYAVYALLFLADSLRVMRERYLLTIPAFWLQCLLYLFCGILVFGLVRILKQSLECRKTAVVLGIHILVLAASWVLLRTGILMPFPIENFFPVSALLTGCYLSYFGMASRKFFSKS